jgi:phage shock protein E
MNPSTIVLLLALSLALFAILVNKTSLISAKDAQAHLKNGAPLLDVRTRNEFNLGHLKEAINIPLERIEKELPRRVTDKSQVLLLHCHSGMRSGVAKKKLRALGYKNAYNIGSYRRAAEIVGEK